MTADKAALVQALDVQALDAQALPNDRLTLPGIEIFPNRLAHVTRKHEGDRVMDAMAWGFPLTTKGRDGKAIEKPVTNVRNYTSNFWRSALANPERRCIVPFTAFSEYGPGQPGKLPLHWFSIPSQPIARFAGVWRPTATGAVYAFLTCEPNPLVGAVHPKAMPVILHPEDYDRWLSAPIADAIELATPFPSQLMVMETPTDLPVAT